jgi:methylthioribose-1-phosphate isomerase
VIEERAADEVTHVRGQTANGQLDRVRVVPEGSPVLNLGFDVTPARLVTGLITEHGTLGASVAALAPYRPAAGDRA